MEIELNQYLIPDLWKTIVEYTKPFCCECAFLKQKHSEIIDLVCDNCDRYYCTACWSDANDQMDDNDVILESDGIYHISSCEGCMLHQHVYGKKFNYYEEIRCNRCSCEDPKCQYKFHCANFEDEFSCYSV